MMKNRCQYRSVEFVTLPRGHGGVSRRQSSLRKQGRHRPERSRERATIVASRKRSRRKTRGAILNRIAELLCVAASIALLHLLWSPQGGFHRGEIIVDVVIAGGWLVWRIAQAAKPRQRVKTWHKPRGLDTIRRK